MTLVCFRFDIRFTWSTDLRAAAPGSPSSSSRKEGDDGFFRDVIGLEKTNFASLMGSLSYKPGGLLKPPACIGC